MSLLVVFSIIFFILIFSLIIFGILSKPKLPAIRISSGQGDFNKICLREKVSCNTDSDCQQQCTEAQEGEEIVCQAIPDTLGLTQTQQKLLGANGASGPSKYCVPAGAKLDCSEATGGIPVFTGWSGVDRMEFDCLCSYPLWASSRVCDQTGNCTGNCLLNPGICQGGTFNWDLTQKTQEPIAGLCECGQGDILVVDNSGLPRCVPSNIQHFYDDLDISTGMRGGQNTVSIDTVPSRPLNPNIPCSSGYTSCTGGCCLLPNAVCCSGAAGQPNFCCPSSYPVCDPVNNRCLKPPSSCGENEVKCSGGCCPLSNGTCCGDGLSCCPPNFPKCDLASKTCNPLLTPISSQKCISANTTQCNDRCCPMMDATCCGDGKNCCPPEYPVCDTVNGMCRMP